VKKNKVVYGPEARGHGVALISIGLCRVTGVLAKVLAEYSSSKLLG